MPGLTNNAYSLSPSVQPLFHSPDNWPIQCMFLHSGYKETVSKILVSPLLHCYSHHCIRQSGCSGTTCPDKSVLDVPNQLLFDVPGNTPRKTSSMIFPGTLIRLHSLNFPKPTLSFFRLAVTLTFFQLQYTRPSHHAFLNIIEASQ